MTSKASFLSIVASPRGEASVSRQLAEKVIARLGGDQANTVQRDVSVGLPLVDGAWIGAAYGGSDPSALETSNALVDELNTADHIVIATPIWNFGVPAALKAWIDQVARAGVTFKYTEEGPQGLLQGKRATIIVTSGGTEVGSAIDFATPYLKHVLAFMGIHDVDVVAADRLMIDADGSMAQAEAQIASLAA